MATYETKSYEDFKLVVKRLFGSNKVIFYSGNWPPDNEVNFIAWAQNMISPHVVIFRTTKGEPNSFTNDYRDDSVEGVLHHPTLFEVE